MWYVRTVKGKPKIWKVWSVDIVRGKGIMKVLKNVSNVEEQADRKRVFVRVAEERD